MNFASSSENNELPSLDETEEADWAEVAAAALMAPSLGFLSELDLDRLVDLVQS